MKVKCDKCGKEYILEKGENPSDYQCDCGGNLISLFDMKKNTRQKPIENTAKTTDSGNGFLDWWNKQNTNTKAGIGLGGICCIGLIIVIAIFAGGSDQNTQNLTTNNNNPTTNQQQTTSAQATWHSIMKTTGNGDKNTPSFTTTGNKFKVKITATASVNATQYATIHFFAYPEGETTYYVGQGSIQQFTQSSMTDEFEVTATPGNYYLDVGAANVGWSIEVFDYY